jgi:hypothetical protein
MYWTAVILKKAVCFIKVNELKNIFLFFQKEIQFKDMKKEKINKFLIDIIPN